MHGPDLPGFAPKDVSLDSNAYHKQLLAPDVEVAGRLLAHPPRMTAPLTLNDRYGAKFTVASGSKSGARVHGDPAIR